MRRAPARANLLSAIALLCGLWFAPGGQAQVQATIKYVGSSTSSLSNTATASITVTVPSGVVAGNVMLALQTYNPWASGGAGPSGWTFLMGNSDSTMGQSVWYRVATSADVAGSTTYTWTAPTAGRVGGAIIAFSGVNTTAPVVANSSQVNAAGTSRTAPSITPGVANAMLVTLYSVENGSTDTLSAPSGMTQALTGSTQDGTGGVLIAGFYELLSASSATGTLTSKSGNSISAGSIGNSVALQPATLSPTAFWHTDELAWNGTAGEVIDSSGNGYNGVAVGGAATAGTSPAIAGSPGTCYYGSFSGSTAYVQLPASLGHIGQTATVTAWIRPTSSNAGRIYWDDYNYDGYALSFGDPGTNRLRFYARTGGYNYTNVDSAVSLTLNQWYFVAAVMDTVVAQAQSVYVFSSSGALLDGESASKTSFNPGTGPYSTLGGDASSSVEGAVARFSGNLDEVSVYPSALSQTQLATLAQAKHACANSLPNHYAVTTPGSAVNCDPAAVTITAHTSTHAVVDTTDTIAISTSSGHGDWNLASGAGTFAAGASNSGTASYTYSPGDAGAVALSLRDTYPETVTINVVDGPITAKSGTATSSEDSALTFVSSGFRVTNGSNVATTIATQRAGVASVQNLALQAVRTDTNTNACLSLIPAGATVSVSLAYQCSNPSSCMSGQSLTLTNNGTSTSLASNPAAGVSSYTSVSLKFSTANAEAPITLNYTDAGQITLAAKYSIPLGSGAGSVNSITGASSWVVQPYTLTLSAIKSNSAGTANPAASTAAGPVFIGAGQSFTATVTASNYQGNATPNFGQELSPASVVLTPALVLPASGHNPPVSGTFGAYAAGSATGTAFSWPEVGILTLTPAVANYLNSGAVTGTTSGDVGRFVPNNFATSLNTPVFGAACTSGGFTYVGQSFGYTVVPVITATAQALGGATTQNYTGSLMRLSDSSLTGRTYAATPSSPALTLTGLPAASADPTIADLGTGQVTLTFSAGSGIAFTRGSPIAPFTANIALSDNVIDLDGVSAANPVTFGASGGIPFSPAATQLYGRIAIRDSVGSELLDLPMPLVSQYYASTSQGFITNSADNCTAGPLIAVSGFEQNLAAGDTCVRDSGSPGVSGAGCSAAAASGSRFNAAAVAGNFNLILAAPGAGDNGAVTVTATVPAWLQYLWSLSSGVNTNPSGLATFGEFPGSQTRVYQREVY